MARVAQRRIDDFLNEEQLEGYVSNEDDHANAVSVENGFFSWSNANEKKEEENGKVSVSINWTYISNFFCRKKKPLH